MRSQVCLKGLDGGVPIGFLAAMGAWRTAERIWPGAQMGWGSVNGRWAPRLELNVEVDGPGVVMAFAKLVRETGARPEWEWAEQIKGTEIEEFRKSSKAAPEWFAAYGSDLVGKEGKLESTPFDMTVARQKFLADAGWLDGELRKPGKKEDQTIGSFEEAMFGPWRYRDNQHHLGWDPATMLLGAYTDEAPTNLKKAGVRAAVWLAMEGLPLFPCCCARGRLGTRGFVRLERKQYFTWPIWRSMLTMRAAASVLGLAELQVPNDEVDRVGLRLMGLAAVFRSRQFKPNKYLASFQLAEQIL